MAMGIYSLLRKKDIPGTTAKKTINLSPFYVILITIPIGIATGVLGASGGIMFLIIAILILKLDIKTAIGTATFVMTISAASGAIGYIIVGHIVLIAALIIGTISIISGFLFSKLGNKIQPATTYKILGVVFIGIGLVQILA